MHLTRRSLGRWLLCVVCPYELHHWSSGCGCCTGAALEQYHGHLMCGVSWVVVLCYDCCIGQGRGCVMAAMPAGREQMCLQFLKLLKLPSTSQLAPCPPWVQQTARTARHIETTGSVSRIRKTAHVPQRQNLWSRVWKPQLLSLHSATTEAHMP